MDLSELMNGYNRMVEHYEIPARASRTGEGWWRCPSCGKRVKLHHAYCSKCGKRLRWNE